MEEIDFDDPRFAPWNIQNLGEFNDAQLAAFLDDDVCTYTNQNLCRDFFNQFNPFDIFVNRLLISISI